MMNAPPGVRAELLVGLEIHAQLRTRSKLFCGCPVRFEAPPNSCVCPVCLGYPGALPVLNREAVRLAALTGLALDGRVTRFTKWDRKSYFYPDLPKNFQISQYDMPIASQGRLSMDVDGAPHVVRIRRAHLEEDAGKNFHDASGFTLVDLNRAGTPLLEIVTEPDLHSAEQTMQFCVELHRLLTYLGVSEGHMKKGQMRFEPNVNLVIHRDGVEFRTPIVEIKNLNSFRAVRNAVEYENRRQLSSWLLDESYVQGRQPNENRGWNEDRGVTEFQRGKEGAPDYRYCADPDLVPVTFGDAELEALRADLPERPAVRRDRLVRQGGLSIEDAEIVVADRATADRFDAVCRARGNSNVAGKQFVNVWLRLANQRGCTIAELPVEPERMAELSIMVADGKINATAANQIAEVMLDSSDPPETIAATRGLVQIQDEAATRSWVEEVLRTNEQALRDALTNPKKAKAVLGFLRGQVMRISGGRADPNGVGRVLEDEILRRRPPSGP